METGLDQFGRIWRPLSVLGQMAVTHVLSMREVWKDGKTLVLVDDQLRSAALGLFPRLLWGEDRILNCITIWGEGSETFAARINRSPLPLVGLRLSLSWEFDDSELPVRNINTSR